MRFEKSCGAVVFMRTRKGIKYVLVQSKTGMYGFPKGHVESGETETQTALREISEEVGMCPTILDGFRFEDSYFLPNDRNVYKTVVYFLAESNGEPIVFAKDELLYAKLVSYEKGMMLLRHESLRKILMEANAFLMKSGG